MLHINNKMYKAVVALNNAGVALIQHQRFMEGLATLKDALCIMKNSFRFKDEESSSTSTSSSLPEQVDVDAALQAAWHRTSQMHNTTTVHNETVPIVVITDQDNPFELYNALERNPQTVYCVKIDPIDSVYEYDTDRYEVESALILYNYGIAYLFASKKNVDQTQTAYQLFELAQSITVAHLAGLDEFEIPSNVLLTSMLVATSLYQLSMQSQHERRIWKNLQCLEWIVSAIIDQEMLYPTLKQTTAASA
jgi:hypothetical protein